MDYYDHINVNRCGDGIEVISHGVCVCVGRGVGIVVGERG